MNTEEHKSYDWRPITNRFYSKRKIYSMAWNVNLKQNLVVGAPFGGPVAVTRRQDTFESANVTPTIDIYTSSGVPITSFLWDNEPILKMGWTTKEELVLVLQGGTVMVVSLFGELIYKFLISKEAREHEIVDCIIWGTGLVIMTAEIKFFAIHSFDDPQTRPYIHPKFNDLPTSWTIVEPKFSPTRTAQVLFATTSGTILILDLKNQPVDPYLASGPFIKMSVSPQGNMLAAFTQNGKVYVQPPDFQGVCHTLSTNSDIFPSQICWCGGDSIVCMYEVQQDRYLLLMIGPLNSNIDYNYNEPLHLIPEIDGIRIITKSDCEIWQLVPQPVVETLQLGSSLPSALLLDASKFFQEQSPQADEFIRKIKTDINAAVKKCIEASSYEFHHETQRKLLRAASYGKCYVEFYSPDEFVNMCKTLRVLNAIRDYEIGIPMTYEQFKAITPRVLITRLINRHHHYLAYSICECLKLKSDTVLIHWASTKVKRLDQSDQVVLQTIVEKLRPISGISYAEIASTAYKYGRSQLATSVTLLFHPKTSPLLLTTVQLLDFEPRAADQVPLLISMKQDQLALKKAIESGDTDLIHLVLLHIKRTKSQDGHLTADFFIIISQQPEAVNLFIAYCKEHEPSLVPEIYEKLNMQNELINLRLASIFRNPLIAERIELLERTSNELVKYKEKTFEKSIVEDQASLLAFQRSLETTFNGQFVGKSISETLYSLCLMDANKPIQKILKSFKVPEKRFYWIKIRALAEIGAWEKLFLFAKEKKSPIGYAPFANVCIDKNAIEEAIKYITRVVEPEERLMLFMRVGAYLPAAQVAAKELKELDVFIAQSIIRDCRKESPENAAQVEELLSKFLQ